MENKNMILIEYKETLKNFKDHLYNIFCSYIRKDYKNTKGDYIRTIELAREELEEDKSKIIKTTLLRSKLLDVEELEKILINDCRIKKAVGDTEIIILY